MLANDSPLAQLIRLDGQKVLRANLSYRTVEDSSAPSSLADFPCNSRCEFHIRLLAHHL